MSWGAPSAGISRSPTTPAATATAPPARPRPRRGGWRRVPRSCSPCPTSTSSSRSRMSSTRWRWPIPGSSTTCCCGCAAETVLELAADPDHLGARTGVLAVLHTWGQTLQFHPHVHCVVPGGGLSPDRTCWVGSRPDFFLPIEVLSRVFRGKFLAGLRAASARGQLRLSSQRTNRGAADAEFERLVSAAVRTRLGGARQASVRRARGGVEVSGPLHPSGGDQ